MDILEIFAVWISLCSYIITVCHWLVCARVEFGRLAVENQALNLGQGFPDYFPPAYVTEALKQVAESSNPFMHQYTRSYVRCMQICQDLNFGLCDQVRQCRKSFVFLNCMYIVLYRLSNIPIRGLCAWHCAARMLSLYWELTFYCVKRQINLANEKCTFFWILKSKHCLMCLPKQCIYHTDVNCLTQDLFDAALCSQCRLS
jgi:hypothetical protein